MKNITTAILVTLFATVFFSCEKTIQLDLKQTEPRVVIEGMVTNQQGAQYVKLTRSNSFYASGATPRITNATVTVTDDNNNTVIFLHNPENVKGSEGIYLPPATFVGEIGRTYTMTVLIDGKTYEAHDKLNPVTSIDSLSFNIDNDEKKDPKKAGKFYRVLIYAKEPKPSVDYYLFKFLRNDTLVFDQNTDISISDDQYIAENIDGIEGDGHYGIGDTATVVDYSLSHDAFVYYSDLSQLLNSSGGIFGSSPANSRTNISNGALGFFQVSAIHYRKAVVKAE